MAERPLSSPTGSAHLKTATCGSNWKTGRYLPSARAFRLPRDRQRSEGARPVHKHLTAEILTNSLSGHPAVSAWGRLRSCGDVPDRVTVLYQKRKTQAYVLHGFGN